MRDRRMSRINKGNWWQKGIQLIFVLKTLTTRLKLEKDVLKQKFDCPSCSRYMCLVGVIRTFPVSLYSCLLYPIRDIVPQYVVCYLHHSMEMINSIMKSDLANLVIYHALFIVFFLIISSLFDSCILSLCYTHQC